MSDEHAGSTLTEYPAHEAHHPHVNYMAVFGALILLTIASYIADKIGGTLGHVIIVLVVLTIACFKAMFVMLYFMHLKFEGKWKFVLLSPTLILALAIIAALMPDIGSHYYDYQVPQTMQADEEDAGHGGAGGHATAPH